MMHLEGRGFPKNPKKASEFFVKAAELRSDEAMCQLGKMSLSGEGMAKSLRNAKSWFSKAAARGNEEAITILESNLFDSI